MTESQSPHCYSELDVGSVVTNDFCIAKTYLSVTYNRHTVLVFSFRVHNTESIF